MSFLRTALEALPAQRENLWRAQRADRNSEAGRLRIALLESLPSHEGYNPVAAERHLKKLSSSNNSIETRDLARLRLAEIAAARDCRVQNAELQQRLDKIVDIERSLDSSSTRSTDKQTDKRTDKENAGQSSNTGR